WLGLTADGAHRCLDLRRPASTRLDPASGGNEQVRAEIGSYVGGLVFRGRGGWIVVKEDGISAVDPVSGRRQVLLHPEADLPGNWFNDCKCDRRGRLWTGSGDRKEKNPRETSQASEPRSTRRTAATGCAART